MLDEKAKVEIEVQRLECPFCGCEKELKTMEEITNAETGETIGHGIDYWTCPVCAAENDIFCRDFEEKNLALIQLVEKNDLQSIIKSQRTEIDDLMVLMLAKWYVQRRDFEKALSIARVLLEINPDDFQAKSMLEFLKKFLGFEKIKKTVPIKIQDIMFALEDHSGAKHFFDKKTGETIVISALGEKEDITLESKMHSNPQRYVLIQAISPKQAFKEMKDFADQVFEEEIKNEIKTALGGKGAFRRFKDVLLNHPEAREEWFDMHNHNVFNRAIDWCIENLKAKVSKGG